MIPLGCRVALRPRSPFEVLDLTVRLLHVEAGRFARAVSVVLLPMWLLVTVAGELAEQRELAGLALLGLAPVLQAPFTLLGGRVLFAEGVRVRDVLRDVPRALPPAVATAVVKVAVAAVGVVSAGLFWLPLHVLVLFQPESSLLERKPLGGAFKRSASLAGDQLGKALLGSIATLAIGAWAIVAAESGMQVLLQWVLQLGTPFGSAADGVVTPWVTLGLVLAQPVIALFRLLLYVDVRTVTEGWDLQVAFCAAAEAA